MDSAPVLTRKVLDLVGQGKLDEALTYIDESFVAYEAESLPYGGTFRGKEGFQKLIGLLATAWDDFDFVIHDIIGTQDTAAVIETISGKCGGKPFKMPITEIWKARNGKIIEATPYYHDTKLLYDLQPKRTAAE